MYYFEEYENMLKEFKDPTDDMKEFKRLTPIEQALIHKRVAFASRMQAEKVYKTTIGKKDKSDLLAVVFLLALGNKHERLMHGILRI